MEIRKVDENLKDIIRSIVNRGNLLNLSIKDFGYFVKIMCPVGTFYVSKIEYLKMIAEILDVKTKVKY